MSSAFRTVFRVALLLYVAWGLFYIARTRFDVDGQRVFSLWDDAMVSMRYARNLAMGQGLVWNPGEAPVEGFSNLGVTLVMAVIHLLPLDQTKTSLVVSPRTFSIGKRSTCWVTPSREVRRVLTEPTEDHEMHRRTRQLQVVRVGQRLAVSDKYIAHKTVPFFASGHSKWDWTYVLEVRRADIFDFPDERRGLNEREDFRNRYAQANAGGVEFVIRKDSLGKLHDPSAVLSAIAAP